MNRVSRWLAAGAGIASASYGAYVARTYLRYGRPKPARGAGRDELLDRVMPAYDVCERRAIHVAAPAETTLAAASETELDSSRIIRGIFKARELILRGTADATEHPRGMLERLTSIGWAVIAEAPGREIVLGAATRPWEANPVFRAIPAAGFTAFAEPDYVKIAVTLRADPDDRGSTFRTETRAIATDAQARRRFRRYWSLLSPGILLIRAAMLPAVKAAAERRWHLEGDDVLPDARAQFTHVVAIDASPRDVWPWLVQMGCQRAGWYSWDILDNAGKRSADRIIPELQHLEPGDVLPWRPGHPEGFKVLRIVPERALVLDGSTPEWAGTWAFVLEPLGTDRTRLVARYRAGYPPSVRMALRLPVMGAIHAFMERKQLRTIKHHAEHMHAA